MQRHANCLPEAPTTSGGRTTGSPAARRLARSVLHRRRVDLVPRAPPRPRAPPACPAPPRPRASARRPRRPTAHARSGISTGRNACAASSKASRAPACASRFVDGIWTHAITTRSQETFCPDVEPGGPTVTPRHVPPAVGGEDRRAGDHREPLRPAALGPKIDDGDLRSGVPQRPGGGVSRVVAPRGPPRAARGARRSDGGAAARREDTITPGRSLPGKTADCSTAPVAKMTWSARIRYRASGPAAATSLPPKTPNAAVSGRKRTPGLEGLPGEPGAHGAARLSQQVAAGLAALLEQDDRCSGLRRLRRGREAGRPGADHQDVGMEVDPPPAPVIGLVRDRAEPGLRPDERLDERPRPPRVAGRPCSRSRAAS